MRLGGKTVAALGYSNPTPFNTPGEYSEQELAERLAPFAGIAPLVLICMSGARSAQACGFLAQRGFDKLYNLNGGLAAWARAGLPLTS